MLKGRVRKPQDFWAVGFYEVKCEDLRWVEIHRLKFLSDGLATLKVLTRKWT